MANVKITELTAATALAGTDVLPIVDVGADATKKVSVSDLLRNLPDGTASAPALAFADDQNTGVLSPGNNSLAFATSGTQRLVIDSSGRVGIGTASPNNELHVSGSGAFSGTASSLSNDQVQIGFTAPEGFIKAKNSSGSPAANLGLYTTNGSGTTSKIVHVSFDGNVGIGTSSPSAKFHVNDSTSTVRAVIQSTAANSYPGVRLTNDARSYDLQIDGATDAFRVYDATASSERLRIDSSGNVGVGTSSPQGKLHVVGASGGAGEIYVSDVDVSSAGSSSLLLSQSGNNSFIYNRNTSGQLRLGAGGASDNVVIDSSGRLLVGATSGAGKFIVQDSSLPKIQANFNGTKHMEFGVGGSGCGFVMTTGHFMTFNHQPYADRGTDNNLTERMRIDSSGRLGLGTSSPDNKLSVGIASADEGIELKATYNGSRIARFALLNPGVDNTPYIGSVLGNDFGFITSGTRRMTLASDGKVRINRTSNLFTEQFIVESDTTSVNPMTVSNTRSSASTDYSIIFGRNGSIVGSIQTSLSATSYVTSSDHRLKQNVVDISDGITRVKQLQPRRFNFIADADTTVDGFLAHEAQTVVPEAVTGTHNQVDDDNNPVYQGIDQSKLVPVLTAALQEAIAKIETLETKVAALEAQ